MRRRREPYRLVDPDWAETGLFRKLAEMSVDEKLALFREVREIAPTIVADNPDVPDERALELAKFA